MSFLYNIGIALYTLLIRLASIFNSKAKAWVNGRETWKKDLAEVFEKDDKVAWFHAASLGEFEQGMPVIEALKEKHPEYKILLTFFSPSGYQQKKDYKGADKVMYLPPDCPRNVKYFIDNLKPTVAIFIKYEFWYNYLSELKKQEIPTIFISALFRKKQIFFKWYGAWFRCRLRSVDHFFVQDELSADLIRGIGVDRVTVSGDTRFDRVATILTKKQENRNVQKFCEGHNVLLAGSTWPPDESMLSGILDQFPDLKIIIAPHEVKAERINQLVQTLNTAFARYTVDEPPDWLDKKVLIIDTIGILSSIYRYADIAYIGGAFGAGLHNIQEPEVNGIPIIFGPKFNNFTEAVDLVKSKGAYTVNSTAELKNVLGNLLSNKDVYSNACDASQKYMLDHTGATERIMNGLSTYIS
jgi:3-deoxy-D-manno-octulosonic-acid transferase